MPMMRRPAKVLTALLLLVQAALSSAEHLRRRDVKPATLLNLRGGNVIRFATEQARTSIQQRARRDDHRSLVCGSRAVLGAWLLFQPTQHFGLTQQPVGRATFQLFFVAHFYLRLIWLLVARTDFFDVPRSRAGKMQKRAVSSAIFVASLSVARFSRVGWAHDSEDMLRRSLPSGLALGVVIARTATSIFDYFSAAVREARRSVAARRAIFRPEHADVLTLRDTWRSRLKQTFVPMVETVTGMDIDGDGRVGGMSDEERALHEAATVARTALKKALAKESDAQVASTHYLPRSPQTLQISSDLLIYPQISPSKSLHFSLHLPTHPSPVQVAARKARGQRLSVQLIRTFIAVTTTAYGLRFACDGSYPLMHTFPQHLPVARAPTPASTAIYVPALVGAFELAQA